MITIVIAFFAGGLVGIVGMSIFAYGARMTLEKDHKAAIKRLQFLEHESASKRFKPVKDPRKAVERLVN
jgi:hypothetical protein